MLLKVLCVNLDISFLVNKRKIIECTNLNLSIIATYVDMASVLFSERKIGIQVLNIISILCNYDTIFKGCRSRK